MTSPHAALAGLRLAREAIVHPSARRAMFALVFGAALSAALVARLGTQASRVAALALLLGAGCAVIARIVIVQRRREDARRVVESTVSLVDPALGAATLRALALVDRAETKGDAGSPELAALHLTRLVDRVPHLLFVERAGKRALVWSTVAVALSLGALGAAFYEPFRVVEGLDVLAADRGEARLSLLWVEDVEATFAPPDYLHEPGGPFLAFEPTRVPRGTVITLRGKPLHAGRSLVLSDRRAEVPFVDDGSGGVVARWKVEDSTTLTIAARFGDARIRQADEQSIDSIPDALPVVVVDDAPRTVHLIDEPAIPIHYEATDDHGLREVDLVLRCGAKEERRPLSRPTTDAKADRGGYELRATDPFFKKSYAPTTITVEAQDNDVVSGPKWGKSAPIVVIPPQVGEPEARRYAALLEARGAFVDLVDDRVRQPEPTAKDAKGHVSHEAEAQDVAMGALGQALSKSYGGLGVKGRVLTLARGQMRRLRRALDAEKKSATATTHKKLVEETEGALLALDAGFRAVAARDTRAVSKRLADIADDAASTLATTEEGDKGGTKEHLDASVSVLDGGGKQLLLLGDLGRDIGEIVAADLRRVGRARASSDLPHAELAARDLAARLRRPDPSFGGGGGGRASVESGMPSSGGGDGEEASDADQQVGAGQKELDDLVSEHESLMSGTQESLDGAGNPEEREHFKDEAQEHAEEVRRALKDLPTESGDPSSAEASAAAGREAAEGMAGALERGDAATAAENGKRAVNALQDAKRLADRMKGSFEADREGKRIQGARDAIERELEWTEEMRDMLRRAQSARAKGDLDEHGKREKKLADRARDLASDGEAGDQTMPEQMLEHLREAEQKMREAERALHDGEGQKGLDKQREAQRLLEQAKQERGEDGQRDGDREGDRAGTNGKADIPGKDKHKGPDDFRKRVLEGLGASSDPLLRDAVKRYAEGLLK
jgi:hypothetical protein